MSPKRHTPPSKNGGGKGSRKRKRVAKKDFKRGVDTLNQTFGLALMQKRVQVARPAVPIKVISIGHDNWAVGYYRIGIPAYYLNSTGLCQFLLRENIPRGDTTRETLGIFYKTVAESQFVVMQRTSSPVAIQFMEAVQKQGVFCVVDTDDHLEAVHELGPCSMTEWWDAGNRAPIYIEGLEKCDMITTASENLANFYRERWPDKVYYLPNPVDTRSDRWNFPHRKYPDTPLTIGWLAGPTHARDADLIAGPVKQIMEEYPEVLYKSVGYHPEFIKTLPQNRVIKAEPAPLEDFPALLDNIDISLVPMVDHDFNRMKTDTKGFESVMSGCAVIASPLGEYTKWREPETILFAKDEQSWVDSLRRLLDNPEQIRQVHREALRYILGFRSADIVVPRWHEAYKSILIGNRRPSKAPE